MDQDVDLSALKAYMHVDHDDDDALILRLWKDSIRELTRGGAITDDSDDTWVVAAALTLERYDGTPLPDSARRIINQLKLQSPVF